MLKNWIATKLVAIVLSFAMRVIHVLAPSWPMIFGETLIPTIMYNNISFITK